MHTMKAIIFSIIMGMALMGAYAGEGDYEEAMKKNLVELDKATTAGEYQQLANSFERISQVAAGEWLPYYYISYCYLNYCFAEGAPTWAKPASSVPPMRRSRFCRAGSTRGGYRSTPWVAGWCIRKKHPPASGRPRPSTPKTPGFISSPE